MIDDGRELFVVTRSGRRVPIFRPDPDSIVIRDIAWGLARRFRWSGQRGLTVAQHSVHVSRRLNYEEEAQWGLLHDAAEAYLGDMPRPLRDRLAVTIPGPGRCGGQLRSWARVETGLLRAIGERFHLCWPVPAAVTEADDREMAREARDLFGDPGLAQCAYPEPLPALLDPYPAQEMFIERVAELFGGRWA